MKKQKRTRKFMSMLIVIAMAFTMIVPVNAAQAGVTIKSHTFDTEADIANQFIITENMTKSFDSELGALKLVSTPDKTWYHLWFYDSNWQNINYDVNEEYILYFKAKTEAVNSETKVNPIEQDTFDIGMFSIGNEWTEYSVPFKPVKGKPVFLKIHMTNPAVAETIYFDEITVVKKPSALDVKSSSIDGGQINPGTTMLTIDFTNQLENPKAEDFVLSGGTQYVTNVTEAGNNSYVIALSDALDINKLYSLAVNVNDIYGQNFNKSYSFAASAIEVINYTFDEDKYFKSDKISPSGNYLAPENTTLSRDNNAIKVVTGTADRWSTRVWINKGSWDVDNYLNLEAGKEYVLNFKAKSDADSGRTINLVENGGSSLGSKAITTEWQTVSMPFTVSKNARVYFVFSGGSNVNYWIDDIMVTTAPDKTSITSSIPTNGGTLDITNTIEVAFSNEMNADSVANPNNYVLEGGSQKVKAVTKKDNGSYLIIFDDVFTPNKEYVFTINALDIYAQKIENNTITFTTPATEIINYTFDEDKYFKSDKISPSGNYLAPENTTLSRDNNAIKVVTGTADRWSTRVWINKGSWDVDNYLNLEAGKEYVLNFKAKSDADSGRTINLVENGGGSLGSKAITTEWQTVSMPFTVSKNARVYFVFSGGSNVNYWIDDIMITTVATDNELHYDAPAVYLDYGKETEQMIGTFEAGAISVAVENIRNLTSEDVSFFVAIALYKDERLVLVDAESAVVEAGEPLESIYAEINVPEERGEGVYAIRTFVWDVNYRPYENSIELLD